MTLRPITFAAPALSNSGVDTENALIRGVSVCTAGLVARGHDLAVDSTTLKQMLAAAEAKGQIPVKVDHKSGAASVCGFLENFRIEGQKLKADWHLLHTHPQTAQILEVAERMPSGVGLSASFLPPEKPEAGKARCGELLSVDYVTLPAANPTGLFSARVQDPATARRKAAVARVAKVVGAGALGAAGAAGIAARGVDRLAGLNLPAFRPSAKVRAGIVGAAGALGAVHTARAVAQRRRRPDYANLNEMEADLAARRVFLSRLIKRVPASGPFPDGFLYHVTSTRNAKNILREGIAVKGTRPTFQNQNSRGRAYLTEAKGVPFWKQRVEEHLTHNSDAPPGVAVLRVRRAGLNLKPDTAGTTDARAGAFYSETPIAAKYRTKRAREMEADLAAALRHFGRADAVSLARELAAAIQQDEAAQAQPVRTVIIHPARPPLKRRALIRAAKIGIGAAGGAYVGRRLGTAAGATTGALAGLLFQSQARNAVRVGLTRTAKLKTL